MCSMPIMPIEATGTAKVRTMMARSACLTSFASLTQTATRANPAKKLAMRGTQLIASRLAPGASLKAPARSTVHSGDDEAAAGCWASIPHTPEVARVRANAR